MADALQMFLLSASTAQPGASAGSKTVEPELSADVQAFADTLAEAGEQPLRLIERQKAAMPSAVDDALVAESVSSESLEAILSDEQSSADDKDAARAWLAIIRDGQKASSGLTLAASKLDQQTGAEADQDQVDSSTLKPKALRSLSLAGAAVSSNQLESETGFHLQARAKVNEQSELVAAEVQPEPGSGGATSADVSSEQAAVSDEPLPASKHTDKRTASSLVHNPEQPKSMQSPSEQTAAGSDMAKAAWAASDEVAARESVATMPHDAEPGVSVSRAGSLADAASDSKASDANLSEAKTSTATAKSEPSVGLSELTAGLADASISEHTATSHSSPLTRSEGPTNQQTLASAVQARAEALSSTTAASSQSGGSPSGEQKDQSSASNLLNAMQQSLANKSNDNAGQTNAADEQVPSPLDSLLRATNATSSLQATGQPQPLTLSASINTAQLLQSQGSAASPANVTPTVSELLRQPVNLLAADATGQLRERLVMMVRNSVHSADIKLDPAELGSMTIRISMQQEQANVHFLVQQAHAREILEQQLPRLRDMLGEHGIELADGQVAQQQSGQQQQDQPAGQAMANEDDDVFMQEQQLEVARPTDRLVDYYA
ncbi:flagellar hook-length control protein FliK [Alkalimonas mucilaginosa]|uniref:Flagellar hook-length control protein FliK n=1 Tax=Alkalimonas mucilaginosa TaxID=3057676 RepID=A0ABU7JHE3_9GAMM|nr:flagellar hook-length control protein FliK [Alkalimonas sp. MEB004]MEE2025072.1 flagellar hook-length control protein FliK [Alkalimonas sp. MEB004]